MMERSGYWMWDIEEHTHYCSLDLKKSYVKKRKNCVRKFEKIKNEKKRHKNVIKCF